MLPGLTVNRGKPDQFSFVDAKREQPLTITGAKKRFVSIEAKRHIGFSIDPYALAAPEGGQSEVSTGCTN